MDYYKPSERILEEIGFDDEGYYQWTILNKKQFTRKLGEKTITGKNYPHYYTGYYCMLEDFFRKKDFALMGNDFDDFRDFAQVNLYADSEALTNILKHSSNPGTFYHGVFLGETGYCCVLVDSGVYYRDANIRELYESKTLPEKHSNGTPLIYNGSDIIELNTTKGALYLAHILSN